MLHHSLKLFWYETSSISLPSFRSLWPGQSHSLRIAVRLQPHYGTVKIVPELYESSLAREIIWNFTSTLGKLCCGSVIKFEGSGIVTREVHREQFAPVRDQPGFNRAFRPVVVAELVASNGRIDRQTT